MPRNILVTQGGLTVFFNFRIIIIKIIIITYSMEVRPLEKPPVAQPLKNVRIFYGTRRLITLFTRALHWSLS
jgi:hypothetical protein